MSSRPAMRYYSTSNAIRQSESSDCKGDAEIEGAYDCIGSSVADEDQVRKFELGFFLVYGLVVAADWLQVCLPEARREDCRNPPPPARLTDLSRDPASTPSTSTKRISRRGRSLLSTPL